MSTTESHDFAPPDAPPVPTLEDVAAELAAVEAELARRSLIHFTKFTFSEYEVNWHHKVVADHLDQVVEGKIKRLMILQPPQTGKSELVSRRFPAYILGRKPDTRIIACSYSASLASEMSRDTQKIVATPEYKALFPGTRLAERADFEVRTNKQFDVVSRRGYYRSAGVGGGITGKSSDLGIVDDPIKNRAEAESKTYRELVWGWYHSTFATRQFGTGGAIIIALTRWHEDDLAGRLLKIASENKDAEQWTVLSFPAILDAHRPYDIRKIGEPLWPARYPLDELRRRRTGMGEYEWSSLYQQQPAPPGGGMFKREWFKIVEDVPADVDRWVRAWDCAGSEATGKSDPDYTVGTLIGEKSGIYYVVDVVRIRETAAKVDEIIKQTALMDPVGTIIREEQEPGSAGKSVIASHTKMLAGFDYAGVPSSGEKTMRWRPFAVQAEAGNVRLIRRDWNSDFLSELAFVPYSTHDDQADSASLAFNSIVFAPHAKCQTATWGRRH